MATPAIITAAAYTEIACHERTPDAIAATTLRASHIRLFAKTVLTASVRAVFEGDVIRYFLTTGRRCFIAALVVSCGSGTQLLNGAIVSPLHLRKELGGNLSTECSYLLPTAEYVDLSLARAFVGKAKLTRWRFYLHLLAIIVRQYGEDGQRVSLFRSDAAPEC